jgi:uncharacterized phage protein gp47/JayE
MDFNTLLEYIQSRIQTIYSPSGQEINFSSASPDGQLTYLMATLGTMVREQLTQVYNAMSPDNCQGPQQDKMYAINYLTRKAGSFSIQNIQIFASQTVSLTGLDGNYNDESATAFGVSDGQGNNWYLIDSTTVYAGITSLPFRYMSKGATTPVVGTLTTPTQVIRGITSVNNPTAYTSIGEEEESNLSFRIRRDQSFGMISGNCVDAIYSQLQQLEGVTSVRPWVNVTNETDDTGTAPHTLWFIVNGGANTDIANVIYSQQGGCDTRGDVSVPINNLAGQTLTINFDRPLETPLYIKFDAQIKYNATLQTLDTSSVAQAMIPYISYDIGQTAYSAELIEIAQNALTTAGDNAYCVNLYISTSTPSGTVTVSGVTDVTATLDPWTFENTFGYTHSAGSEGTYTFTGSCSDGIITWNGGNGDPTEYGVTLTGTPSNGTINVVVKEVAMVWNKIMKTETIQNQFTVAANQIWVNKVLPND